MSTKGGMNAGDPQGDEFINLTQAKVHRLVNEGLVFRLARASSPSLVVPLCQWCTRKFLMWKTWFLFGSRSMLVEMGRSCGT